MTRQPPVPALRDLTRFFLPLVFIAFSQAFTYPLVASVVSNGPMGALEYEAYVIGQHVVTFLASTSLGLVTTGIVFATSRRANRNFARLGLLLAAAAVLCQAVAGLPAAEELVFGRILAVDAGPVRTVARRSLLACIPVQANFYIRNILMAPLFRAKRSDLANAATLVRVALTVAVSFGFTRAGLGGYGWGAVAMTLPCLVETFLTWQFARPFLSALPEAAPDGGRPASILTQLRYSVTLAFGYVLLTATEFIVISFYSKSSDPERFRLVHFVAYGLACSFFAGAQQLQTVTVVFAKTRESVRRVFAFAFESGAALAAVLLALCLCAPFARWYFCDFQKIPAESLACTVAAAAAGAAITVLCGIRGFVEGLAAVRLKPRAVLAGQAAYVLAFWGAFAACPTGLAGRDHLWGMAAIAAATAVSAAATHLISHGVFYVSYFTPSGGSARLRGHEARKPICR